MHTRPSEVTLVCRQEFGKWGGGHAARSHFSLFPTITLVLPKRKQYDGKMLIIKKQNS